MRRLRICHLTTVHHRYDTRIYVKECRSLARSGFDVTLLVADGKGDEIQDGVRIEDTGAPGSRAIRLLQFRRRMLKKALLRDADLYHFHDPELLGVGIALAKKGRNVIYDAHEDVPRQLLTKEYIPGVLKRYVSAIFEKYEDRAAKRFSGIITATPIIRDRFLRVNKETVEVQNFPTLEEFDHLGSSGEHEKVDAVCYVGSISRPRGIINTIRAFQHLEGTRLILGGSFETEELRSACIALPGWEKVIELGFIGRPEVRETLDKSVAGLVVLRPTLNYLDSIPVKMFEYMAAGIPVIASDFPYWRELLSGTDCAIFVDPDEPKDIAEAIRTLVEDRERSLEMGKAGREAVVEKFNWRLEAAKLKGLYARILGIETNAASEDGSHNRMPEP